MNVKIIGRMLSFIIAIEAVFMLPAMALNFADGETRSAFAFIVVIAGMLLLTLLPASEPQHNAVIAQVQPKVVNQSPVAAHPEESVEPAPVAIPHKAERKTHRHSEPAIQEMAPAEPELAPVVEEEPVVEEQFSRSRMEYVAANRDDMRRRINEQYETLFSLTNNENTDKS